MILSNRVSIGVVVAILVGIGSIESMWPVADAGIGMLALMLWAKGARPARTLVLFGGLLLPGVFFGVAPGIAGLMFWRWLALGTVAAHLRGYSGITRAPGRAVRSPGKAEFFDFGNLIALVLIIQTLVIPFDLYHHPRAAGVSLNPYLLGEIGLGLFMMIPRQGGALAWITSTIYLAGSLTRSTLGAAVVYSLVRREWRLIWRAGVICLLFALVLVIKSPGGLSRLDPEVIRTAAEVRWSLNSGDTRNGSRDIVIEALGPLAPEYSAPRFTWLGYGLGGYLAATGLQRPHNLFVLLAYELGVFGLGVLGLVGWWIYNRYISISFFITLGLLGLFTEDMAIRPEVQYIFFAVAIMHLKRKPPAISPGALGLCLRG